jgi:hypothetical protein
MVATGTRRPRRGSRLCRRWALKWREEGQLLGQCLRATKCDKLSVILHYIWPRRDAVRPQLSSASVPPRFKRKRTSDPKPFEGLTQRLHCAACAHDVTHPKAPPPRRPNAMPPTNRRPCAIDTSRHFCPHEGCDYRGWLGLGNLRANGHPSGGPWRQLYCRSCDGYFLETHGTLFHGKRLSVELIVQVLACLAGPMTE